MQDVIKETVFFVPKALTISPAMIHRPRDVQEVLPELTGDVFVSRVMAGKLDCDGQQVQCVHCHPTRAVGLFDVATGRQWRAAIEYTDVVKPQESALENVQSFGI